jgi:hypothetical protein
MLAALAAGRPLGEHLAFLRGLAPSDPVVAAALQAVSERSAGDSVAGLGGRLAALLLHCAVPGLPGCS